MKYIIYASQFTIQHKREMELVKTSYQIVKNIIKVLDLGWSFVL